MMIMMMMAITITSCLQKYTVMDNSNNNTHTKKNALGRGVKIFRSLGLWVFFPVKASA